MVMKTDKIKDAAEKAKGKSNVQALAEGKRTNKSNVHDDEMYKYINLKIPFDLWKDIKAIANEQTTPAHTVTVTGYINSVLAESVAKDRG